MYVIAKVYGYFIKEIKPSKIKFSSICTLGYTHKAHQNICIIIIIHTILHAICTIKMHSINGKSFNHCFVLVYVKRKVWIRTILGFCCANVGSDIWRNNPRIAHANLESTRNHLGLHNQTSAIRGNKPTTDRMASGL